MHKIKCKTPAYKHMYGRNSAYIVNKGKFKLISKQYDTDTEDNPSILADDFDDALYNLSSCMSDQLCSILMCLNLIDDHGFINTAITEEYDAISALIISYKPETITDFFIENKIQPKYHQPFHFYY